MQTCSEVGFTLQQLLFVYKYTPVSGFCHWTNRRIPHETADTEARFAKKPHLYTYVRDWKNKANFFNSDCTAGNQKTELWLISDYKRLISWWSKYCKLAFVQSLESSLSSQHLPDDFWDFVPMRNFRQKHVCIIMNWIMHAHVSVTLNCGDCEEKCIASWYKSNMTLAQR